MTVDLSTGMHDGDLACGPSEGLQGDLEPGLCRLPKGNHVPAPKISAPTLATAVASFIMLTYSRWLLRDELRNCVSKSSTCCLISSRR